MSSEPKFCGKCGSSLKDNVKFCTNCGTEINEDITIKRTTRDEFLNRYHGTKILDHINEMIDSNIGDRQRLEAIHHLLESRQELDYVNFYYLKECSDKYNTKVKSNEIIPKQIIHTEKKQFSKYKIIGIVIALVFVSMIAIGVSLGSNNDSNTNEKSSYEIEQEKEKEIIKAVQDYKGKDDKGETIVEVLTIILDLAYRNENIADNPSTEIGWYTFEDISLRNNDGTPIDGVYQVGFSVKTYRDDIEYIWYYNTNTKEIHAANNHGKTILDGVDSLG